MKSVFITGTDTGIGKTVVASSLLAAARSRGVDAVPMKPVQTGCAQNGAAPDIEFCLREARVKLRPEERRWICPYRFGHACSPHLAARLARKRIRIPTIVDGFNHLFSLHESVIVEGAGGVLVPLDERNTMLDIMKALRLPVILVARAGLGTINHVLLSLRELRRAKLKMVGVVFVQSTPGKLGVIEKENARIVEKLGGVKVLACLRYRKSLDICHFAGYLNRVLEELGV